MLWRELLRRSCPDRFPENGPCEPVSALRSLNGPELFTKSQIRLIRHLVAGTVGNYPNYTPGFAIWKQPKQTIKTLGPCEGKRPRDLAQGRIAPKRRVPYFPKLWTAAASLS